MASIMSTSLLGALGPLVPMAQVRAQDVPSAAAELDRGQRLFDQKNYAEAKKVLTAIDPGQLPEDQRARLVNLTTKTDVALAQAMGPAGALDAAAQDEEHDRLAAAVSKLQAIIADPATPADVKASATAKLASVQLKQTQMAKQMHDYLTQAQALYDQNKLDDAQAAINKITAVGAPLNWEDTPRVNELQGKIAAKRLAMAAGPGTAVAAGTNPMDAAVGASGSMPAGGATIGNGSPMDVQPPTGGAVASPVPTGGGSLLNRPSGSPSS